MVPIDTRMHAASLLALIATISSAPARAQDVAAEPAGGEVAVETVAPPSAAEAAARVHIDQGTLFFEPPPESGNAPNYEAALAEFDEAHRLLEDDPERYYLLWNIGQCYERLFRYERALEYYRLYLEEGGPHAADRGVVEATMRALENLLGVLRITVNVPGATVWVDGLEVGHAPGDVRVTSGVHRVELRAEGWVPGLEEVQITARQTVPIAFELRALSVYEGIDGTAFWVTTCVALAALAAGTVIGIVVYLDFSGEGSPRTQEAIDRRLVQSITADVLFATGGALAIASTVLAFMTDWDGPTRTAPPIAVLPVVTGDSVGLVLGGTL